MKAWAARDLDTYASHYAEKFRYKRMNLKAYKKYKKRVFSSYKKMVVKFSDVRVITHPKYAVTLFNQEFYGDNR